MSLFLNPLLSRLYAVCALALLCAAQGYAATTQDLVVNVSLTIDSDISVVWCDNAGANDDAAARTWALGTGIALNTAYDSDTQGTQPTLKYIQNLSNAAIDVSAICANSSPSAWVSGAAAGSNQFLMEAKFGAGSYVALNAAAGDIVDDLAKDAVSGKMVLRITTPTAITVGGGLAQTMTVTFTCTADNGD